MHIDDIRKLVELMEERGVIELEMEDQAGKIRLVRENHRVVAPVATVPVISPLPATPLPVAPMAPPIRAPAMEPAAVPPGLQITSPMVGTFYRASGPDATPYVEIGTVVEKGDVVCIIEAMKMMNEIQAETRGRVLEILVENAHPVEYGQPLFVLESL
jgi:acetyl-CoA carboxylase biotin carboxyl carrier protein